VRFLYRVHQFWHALRSKPDPGELTQAQKLLSPEQWKLFCQLKEAEQAHSLVMYRKLIQQGDTQSDLLTAALLHDIGKLQYPISPIERAVVIIVSALAPEIGRKWGNPPDCGWERTPAWQKPFIVKALHAEWGAVMARKSGASLQTVELVRLHHQPPTQTGVTIHKTLQYRLWQVDNNS
jgi:putative nucleotidyltransferase with HDIG domain